jgi:futalosine hydrolase
MSTGTPSPGFARASLGSPTLLFVPTRVELEGLAELGGFEPLCCITRICGFGPVAAAASAAQALAELRPARAVLLGIAGTYDIDRIAIGSAAEFDEVAIDGIGAGESAGFRSPAELGFPHWTSPVDGTRIFDRIALGTAPRCGVGRRLLLSVCATSDSRDMASARHQRFPEACAEDMEGFGVALASAIAGVPLRIVRGISNAAGDRDHARWRVREALAAARALLIASADGASAEPGSR